MTFKLLNPKTGISFHQHCYLTKTPILSVNLHVGTTHHDKYICHVNIISQQRNTVIGENILSRLLHSTVDKQPETFYRGLIQSRY